MNILLAEDNKVVQKMTKKILSKLGHECTIASNGLEAVECYNSSTFDLVLMDMMMPVMNGFDAAKKIHDMDSSAKIIAVTAVNLDQNRDQFEHAGIKHIVNKPINAQILDEKINSVLYS